MLLGLTPGGVAVAAERGVEFEIIDSVEPGSSEFYGLAVDSEARRAYVLDASKRSVRPFDISDRGLKALAPIPVSTIDYVYGLAVNQKTHQVFTINKTASGDELVIIDGSPDSSTYGTIDGRLLTGSRTGFFLSVDPSSNRVAIPGTDEKNVTIIDADDGARTVVPTGIWHNGITVDPSSGMFYAFSADDRSIAVIRPDNSWTRVPVDLRPRALAVADDRVVVAGTSEYGNRLQSYDVATLAPIAVSAYLSMTSGLAVDVERHAVYVAQASVGAAGVEVLRLDDLSHDGAGAVTNYNSVALDSATHRLITIQNALSSEIHLLEPHLSPLPSVDRIDGADRYAVAAAASRDSFGSGAPVAYIASGQTFPDALSGAAAAGAQSGPVLLVTRDGVPSATIAELKRLRPRRIVVLGGTSTIAASVEKALGEYSSNISRIKADDRYGVSAAVSATTFPDGSDFAYLASGEVFPDALSASPLSGREPGPVLLTRKGEVPPRVATELKRLAPDYIYIMGGVDTVGAEVVAAAEKVAPVIRIDGTDRYVVSAEAAERSFRASTYSVYVASGEVFADALAGGAPAIANGAPVLLVKRDEIPSTVAAELERLAPYRIVVLGGESTVSPTVVEQLREYLPD
jgi:putative cell wall-binding protein